MSPKVPPRLPWLALVGGRQVSRQASAKAAIKVLDRGWRIGWCQVRHETTGECWDRRDGSWFKTAPGNAAKAAPAVSKGAAT